MKINIQLTVRQIKYLNSILEGDIATNVSGPSWGSPASELIAAWREQRVSYVDPSTHHIRRVKKELISERRGIDNSAEVLGILSSALQAAETK